MENNQKDYKNEEKEAKKQIEELRQKLHLWNHHYFDLDNPIVDDLVYDQELNKLKKLEKKYFYLFTIEENNASPTQIVGAKTDERFQKIKHSQPMLSLNKAYTFEELEKFAQKALKIYQNTSFYVEPKIDGISISLHYKQGKFTQALTRGDGTTGEDVSHNIENIDQKYVPKQINYLKDIEIRGEVFLDLQSFKNMNLEQEKIQKPLFLNPRNAAAGTLRRLDSKTNKLANLKVFVYQVVQPQEHNLDTVADSIKFLQTLGFNTNNLGKHKENIHQSYRLIQEIQEKENKLDYEIDGVVVKVNEFKLYEELGTTSKFPHSAIAFKFSDKVVQTKLKDIFATVGRTGKITYNAVLEPVLLQGSTISAATLHNYNYIKDLAINTNSMVYIKKAGEIIPQVIQSVEKFEKTNFEKITNCPECHSDLIDSETGIDQFCVNPNCLGIQLRKIIHFCSKEGLDIKDLGEKKIELFWEQNLIRSIPDIFRLATKIEEISKLKSFQQKSILKLINAIEKAKHTTLDKLIFALGIKHIGQKTAKMLAQKVDNLEQLKTFNFDTFLEDKDIGEKTVESLKNYFKNEANLQIINELIQVNFEIIKEETHSNILENLSFVITGTLSRPRSQIESIILQNKGKVSSSVSKNTSYLILGENGGSKEEKARSLGVKILSEKEFFDLLNN
ncbi:NAD-dependent DNA ligase LigA [Mycoplasma sp. 1654_15]|uniref:NAD-dependent DNA ligase LigA n=1 Tax=Mycoplasma sp. 1654_15 TaxID=2725994 RepID=UPI0014491093|nr:NAD-dependent DNA ligase LigA [Mycoplasma sp. 1654_15]QJB71475.1 NAD-dependent DNA ligase LigA [Mycoplasma sp. 1654_15]